ncbi:sensor histidine kinase [Actinomadura atramentaria]|uniref:sensor histidine kinase n=1 Tax=Actinomadura atramentaria TaxID=1990 RepID=UPI0003687CA7|nr:sensor histidine kinase [Actinomadura atramentaria]
MSDSPTALSPARLRRGVRAALSPRAAGGDPPGAGLPAARFLRVPAAVLVGLVALGCTGGTIAIPLQVFHPPPAATLAWLLGIAQVLPLAFAPFRPLPAWRVSAAGFLAGGVLLHGRYFWPWPVPGGIAFLLLLYFVAVSAARESRRETLIGVGALTIGGVIVPTSLLGMPGWFAVLLSLLVTAVLVFGDAVGGRTSAERELARQAEVHRADLARRAVLEERARIARELHDVVAHHMSVIAMQAEAAPYKIDGLPEEARRTFGIVRDAAREALTETRRVVGLLRAEDEDAERSPQPGLARLDDLAAAARRAGLTVAVSVTGVPRPLDAGVDLSAYRIVQESLSNAARYAPGGRASAELRYGRDALTVAVRDEGAAGPAPSSRAGGGHGLVGMRERVAMLGGTFAAGPAETGGWSVTAVLPYGGG